MVQAKFIIDEFFILVRLQRVELKIEVEAGNWLTNWLVIGEVQVLQIGMRKSIIDRNALGWVEQEHLFDEVDSERILPALEKLVKICALTLRKLSHELLVVFVFNHLDEIA